MENTQATEPKHIDQIIFILSLLFRKALELWHLIPHWIHIAVFILTALSALIFFVQVIFGREKTKAFVYSCLERGLNIAGSINHNYGRVIGEFIGGISLVVFGVALKNKIEGHHTPWFWATMLYSSFATINKNLKTSNTTGREFAVFFDNRSGAAKAMSIHNEKYPPAPKSNFNYRTSSITRSFVEDVLENHLDLLHRTLRLGFSWHGKDNFAASLLLYDPNKKEWHKWTTVYEKGVNPAKVRSGSAWPIQRSDFMLPDNMYMSTRPRLFDVQRLQGKSHYSAVLTIPLYFRRNGSGGFASERKGDLFGALSYSNTNSGTFNNLTVDKFLKHFALEMAVIERVAFRIYRDYNF